jgi:general secretion pathway protein E
LTGHLVFSTLHTNDAASGVTRLLDMGIEPYLIASSVECFIAQRLVRLLCPHCKVPLRATPEVIHEFGLTSNDTNITVYEAKGCKECRQTGYMGRQAICEFLIINDDIRSLIVRRVPAGEIKDKAVALGMKTLRQHGWEKVAAGITSPSEVLRATREDQ